jgi:hypothetical protein
LAAPPAPPGPDATLDMKESTFSSAFTISVRASWARTSALNEIPSMPSVLIMNRPASSLGRKPVGLCLNSR